MAEQREMEAAVEKVEAMFRKADSNIEYLSRKLNDDFLQSMEGDCSEISPLEMKRRLQAVKKEFASLQADAENIKTAQEEMMTEFRSQLTTVSQVLQSLQTTTGVEVKDSKDQEAIIESLLGFKLPSALENGDNAQQTAEGNDASPTQVLSPGGDASLEAADSPTPDKEEEIPPHEVRLSSPEFYPVQESEFQSVSDIVRGRATLSELNRTYRKLYDHFKAEPNSGPLMTRDMVSMGMRITGATGQAKLRILRSLKIIEMTSKGDVRIV